MTVPSATYAWVELAAKLPDRGMVRNHFVRQDDRDSVRAWRENYRNTDVYATVCRFQEPNRDSAYVCDFFLDIDASELDAAYRDALLACNLIIQRLGIDPDSLDLSFSGAKGFHVIVPGLVFGEPEGPEVMTVWRCLASRLAKEGVSHIDRGVYQKSRVLRLANSIHSNSKLYKISLEYRELADLGLGYILDLARQPREHDSMAIPSQADKATQWMHEATAWVKRLRAAPSRVGWVRDRSGWRLPPCIRAIEQVVLQDGIRHAAYFEFARYMATVGAAPDEILRRLRDIDRRNSIGDDAHLESLARRAARYAGFKTCPLPQLNDFCDRNKCFLVCQEMQDAKDAADGEARPPEQARPGQPDARRDEDKLCR
jgi:hypothetical protein